MTLRIDLVVTGPDLAAENLAGMASRARDSRKAFRFIMGDLLKAEGAQFETGGARSGRKWAPDKQSTIARKKRDGQSVDPERRTRELELSLVAWTDPNGIRRINKQSLVLGTKLPYAAYQYKRPLLRFVQKDIDKAQARLVGWLLDGNPTVGA